MSKALSRIPRCILVLTLSTAPVLGLIAAMAWTWIHLNANYEDQVAEALGRLSRAKNLIAQHPHLEEELHTLKTQWHDSGHFIQGDSPTLAAAGLHEKVRRLAHSNRGNLVSAQILDPVREHDRLRITVRFRIKGDESAMFRILHGLEGGRPLLFIDNLSIQGSSKGTARSAHPSSGQLNIGFDLFGYLLEEA